MGWRTASVLTVAVALLAGSAAAADEPRKGPYLQHLSASSVDIRLELGSPAAATVEVRSAGHATVTAASPTATLHTLHVAGLSPATRYDYTVHMGPSAIRAGSFVTAEDDASHDPVTFIAYGDTRSDDVTHARVASALGREKFDFLIHTGDFVIAGSEADAWQSFFDVEEPILASHCVFACIGNHELSDDRDAVNFERYFGPTQTTGLTATSPARLYGTVRWGRARFFLLNAFQDWSGGPERAWLEQALAAADHEPDLAWRIAVIHHGPFSAGIHGSSKALLAAHVDDLLRAHHVDLVIAGHDHIYERGEAAGLKYLVTGGGGAPLYRELSPRPSTRKVEAVFHYVLATLTDDTLSITAKRLDGSVLEQCTAGHSGSWLCDPAPPVAAAPSSAALHVEAPDHASGCACSLSRAGGLDEVAVPLGLAAWFARRRRRLT